MMTVFLVDDNELLSRFAPTSRVGSTPTPLHTSSARTWFMDTYHYGNSFAASNVQSVSLSVARILMLSVGGATALISHTIHVTAERLPVLKIPKDCAAFL